MAAPRVRRESSHRCPADGCEVYVPDSVLACKTHWFRLPRDIRSRVNRWYELGQTAVTMSDNYRAALTDAVDFWRANP